MGRSILRTIAVATVVVAGLFGGAQSVMAGVFAGVYTGTFSSPCDSGEFAVLLRNNNVAVVAAYAVFDEEGFVNEGVLINADGSFSASDIDGQGTSVDGSFTASGVSGTLSGTAVDTPDPFCTGPGTFTGVRQPDTGVFDQAGGYYTGELSGTVNITGNLVDSGTISGNVFAIVAANGESFTFLDAIFDLTVLGQVPGQAGGAFTINPDGSIAAILPGGGPNFSGNLDTTTFTAAGTFFESEIFEGITITTSGSWSATRRLRLPKLVKSMPWLLLLLDD